MLQRKIGVIGVVIIVTASLLVYSSVSIIVVSQIRQNEPITHLEVVWQPSQFVNQLLFVLPFPDRNVTTEISRIHEVSTGAISFPFPRSPLRSQKTTIGLDNCSL